MPVAASAPTPRTVIRGMDTDTGLPPAHLRGNGGRMRHGTRCSQADPGRRRETSVFSPRYPEHYIAAAASLFDGLPEPITLDGRKTQQEIRGLLSLATQQQQAKSFMCQRCGHHAGQRTININLLYYFI